MSDEMFIEGKSYISSKRAAQLSTYAQDYIGQLARKGLIEAQRIGGLWYVAMDSLESYKDKAASFKPNPPVVQEQKKDPSTLVFFDGKEYISASRAADMTGYVQDYVGQLARLGQILARQVGNRWYVEKESILRHKQEKEGLLAAVQAEAVGLQHLHKPMMENKSSSHEKTTKEESPIYTYSVDTADLLPIIRRSDNRNEYVSSQNAHVSEPSISEAISIPIRKSAPPSSASKKVDQKAISTSKNTQVQLLPLAIGAAATIVIVLSVGYSSVLKQNSVYASAPIHIATSRSLAASVAAAFNRIGDALEPLLTHEILYTRVDNQ